MELLAVHESAAMKMGGPLAERVMEIPPPPYLDVEISTHDFTLADIESLEAKLLRAPQVEIPLTHMFAPDVYWREVKMPAGSFVIGQQHKTRHFNVILTGSARVLMDGVMHHIVAPCVLVSEPNVRKMLYIEEEMRWATIHPTSETDLDLLEDELIIKSGTFKNYQKELEQFQNLLEEETI